MNPSIKLIQGLVSEDAFNNLLNASRIRSQPLINALSYHFVYGAKISSAYEAYGVSQQAFVRGVDSLNKTYERLESDVINNISKDKV